MTRDLRDVVNKIIVTVSDDEPTNDEIAGLASDLAAFFDASVVLVYLGKMPLTVPPGEGPIGQTVVVAAAVNVIEENGRNTLDRMAEVMIAHGVQVSSRLVMSDSHQAIKTIIEQEKCDLLIIPHWESGTTQRLLRVFSPSILEDATCPVLILKGNRWLSESKAERASLSKGSP
ncbi:MAG: universal stress protein [Thaumarchaeota archaeon]|nr:universal stress protein [Nitrososphaerota archaeon]